MRPQESRKIVAKRFCTVDEKVAADVMFEAYRVDVVNNELRRCPVFVRSRRSEGG